MSRAWISVVINATRILRLTSEISSRISSVSKVSYSLRICRWSSRASGSFSFSYMKNSV